jgi:AraC family transcriptional regulator of arabinose operon
LIVVSASLERLPEFEVPAPNNYRRARVGHIIQRPGELRGMRVPLVYRLLYIHTGEAFLTRGPQGSQPPVHIPAGNAVLLRPQDLSHSRTIGTSPSRQSWVAIVPDALTTEQLSWLDATPDAQPLTPEMDRLQTSIVEIAWRVDAIADATAGEAVLSPLIVGAFMLYVQEARRAGRFRLAERLHPAVTAARETIRRHLDTHLELRDLAAATHVTPEHLVRLFRRELGITPARYLWSERVRAGIYLLERTRLPISEIAHRAGFQTPSHFSRLVRRAVGCSPGAIRERAAVAGADSVHPAR